MIKSSIISALAAAFLSTAAFGGLPNYPLVPGEAIIRTHSPKQLAGILAQLSSQFENVGVIDQIDGRPIYLLSYALNANQTSDTMHAVLDQMTATGAIAWGELNYVGQTGEGNTDSLWLSGLSVNSSSFWNQYPINMLGLFAAHDRSRGAGVVVSVIDTGIDSLHPVFQGRVSSLGVSFVPNSPTWSDIAPGIDSDGDGMVDEQHGHGTFVAGLIHLVAPDAMILSARALDSNGHGNNFQIAKAVAWSIDRGAHVVNMSLGEVYQSVALGNMVAEARSKGIVVCGAAGNRNASDPREYPACDANALGVSAFNWDDDKAPFSNYEVRIDLAAPGDSEVVNGVPNLFRSIVGPVPGNGYAVWKGTSFANAFVSGTVALVRAQHPTWPDSQVRPAAVVDTIRGTLVATGIPIVPSNPAFNGLLGDARIFTAAAVLDAPQAPPVGDINGDGFVGGADLTALLSAWGPQPRIVRADLNADGVVDGMDLTALLSAW